MNSVETSKSTKDKILQTANTLFAKNGFGRTSVRDIASEANVNLAAINYHFKNKDNLYLQVFQYNFDWISFGIQGLNEESIDTAELAVRTFRFFLQEKTAITNIFKIFLSDHSALYDDVLDLNRDSQEMFGPPGQEVFLSKISKDVSKRVSSESQVWIMKAVFTQVAHYGLMMGTEFFKRKCNHDYGMAPDAIEHQIRSVVMALIQYANDNPKKNLMGPV